VKPSPADEEKLRTEDFNQLLAPQDEAERAEVREVAASVARYRRLGERVAA